MYADLNPILERAQVLLLELAELSETGIVLKIVHRFHAQGTACMPGEEIWGITVRHRNKELPLSLPLALRLLLNYLAETRHVPQSASQIAAGMRRAAFYNRHGANSGIVTRRKFARSAIKEYIKRLRLALATGFSEVGLSLDPARVLVSRGTVANEVQYQLRATIHWVHVSEAE